MRSSQFVPVLALMAFAFFMGYFVANTVEQYPLGEGRAVSVGRDSSRKYLVEEKRIYFDDDMIDSSQDSFAVDGPPIPPAFLPIQEWEWPNTCTSRPDHIPERCCYGGVKVFREFCEKFNKSHVEEMQNYTQYYREHKRYDFFHGPTSSPSPCNECQIADYMLQHNLTVSFLGDSVMDQTWVGMDCSLRRRGYHLEETTVQHWQRDKDTWWKYGLGPHRVTKLVGGGPNNVAGEARLVYLHSYRRPLYGGEMFHVIANSDVVIFDHGVHWQPKLYYEFREEMAEYLKHFRTTEAAHIRLLAWRETSPQHFNNSGGYYVPGIEKKTEYCMPIKGNFLLNDDDERGYYVPLMQNATTEAGLKFRNAMEPEFRQSLWTPFELVYLPYREFARELYANHPNSRDCTHHCNTMLLWQGVWRGLRLAMDRAFGPRASLGKGFSEGNFTGKLQYFQ